MLCSVCIVGYSQFCIHLFMDIVPRGWSIIFYICGEIGPWYPHIANGILFAEGIRLPTLFPIVLLSINSSWKGEKSIKFIDVYSFVISFLLVCPLAFQVTNSMLQLLQKTTTGTGNVWRAFVTPNLLISTATQSRNHPPSEIELVVQHTIPTRLGHENKGKTTLAMRGDDSLGISPFIEEFFLQVLPAGLCWKK